MLLKEKFVSTTELQRNLTNTIEKAKKEDILIMKNNKPEVAMIPISWYEEFLEFKKLKEIKIWEKSLKTEQLSEEAESELLKLMDEDEVSHEEVFSNNNIEV